MLLACTGTAPPCPIAAPRTAESLTEMVWLDLFDPTEAERALVERATGLRVPSAEEINEIETSSRLRVEGQALYLSTPLSMRLDGDSMVSSLGFVLSSTHLITVRYAKFPAFETYQAHPWGDTRPSSMAVFIGLLEAIVDRLADVLESVGRELDGLSRRIFHADQKASGRRISNDVRLRSMLRGIGRLGDLISNVRDSLLGIMRIATYASDMAASWMPPALPARFKTLRQDLASLNDYDAQLTNKVQLLLDATLGFINIEQNNGIKVLTIASLIGIPPTLIASIYGMNFKIMPELNWDWGYPYALALIALSILAPLLWAKRRGWL
jgi:magnesium transporter